MGTALGPPEFIFPGFRLDRRPENSGASRVFWAPSHGLREDENAAEAVAAAEGTPAPAPALDAGEE